MSTDSDVGPLGSDARSLTAVIDSRADQLTELRRRVRELATSVDCPDAVSSDLELVVSELATNVIRHTRAPSMNVHVEVESGAGRQQWTVCVDNQVLPISLDDDDGAPAPPAGGRGLRIVAAIMDDIDVSETDGRMTIRTSLAVST
jgi:anti-sigma regulatory factor (Ser/Thr protein kinase)